MKAHPGAIEHGVEDPTPSWPPNGHCGSSPAKTAAHRTENYGSASTQVPRLLETVVLIFEDGAELLVHAMPRRTKYLDLLP